METEYETISPFLDIPTLEVFEDSRSRTVARMSMQIDSFFERKPVEGKIWAPPDSWAVTIPPPEEIKETSMINLMGATVSAPDLLSEFEEIDLQRDEQEMDFGYRRHGSTDSEFTVITQFSRSSDLGGLADPNMVNILLISVFHQSFQASLFRTDFTKQKRLDLRLYICHHNLSFEYHICRALLHSVKTIFYFRCLQLPNIFVLSRL